ncbi:MAG TPA: hypothetical protein VHM72_03595 [Solirubrobacteraceae bacterium]|nr:hypothetical protein [Solirubrobacteraceae bacterium]
MTADGSGTVLADVSAGTQRLPRARGGRPAPPLGGEWLAPDRRDAVKSGAAAAASSAALTAMILISLIIVSLAASQVPRDYLSPTARPGDYPTWLAGPLAALTSWVSFSSATLEAVFTAGIATMYLAYIAVLICAPRVRPAFALSAVVVLQVIFFLSPPLPLTDIFNYLNYGRMEVLYHLNPYTTIPALEPHNDPVFSLSNWHGLESPYGPLLTLITMAVVPLGIAGSYWILKTALLLTSLGSVWLVWGSAGLLGRHRLSAALFVGLNPIVLVWGLGADHSDFLMIFLVTLGMYLLIQARVRSARAGPPGPVAASGGAVAKLGSAWRRALSWIDGAPRPLGPGQPGWWWAVSGGILLIGAVAIKASAVVLIPIVLAGSARRLRLATGFLIGAAGLAAASIAAFGLNVPDLSQQDALVIPGSVPNVVGYLIGDGGASPGVRLAFTIALAAVVVVCTIWAWRSHDWMLPCGVAILALLLTLSWELPWYLIWLLPFAALARGRRIRIAAIVLGVYMFMVAMPYSTTVERAIGLHPNTTIVGRANQRFLHALLF